MRKIAICDDSKLDRQLLKVVIQTYFENNEEEFKIFEYESGDNLLADIEEGHIEVELLFRYHYEWNKWNEDSQKIKRYSI